MKKLYYRYNTSEIAEYHPNNGIFLSLENAAKYLNITKEALLDLIEKGYLPVYIFGKTEQYFRVWSNDLIQYLLAKKITGPSKEDTEAIRKLIKLV